MMKKKGLGRGLSALMADVNEAEAPEAGEEERPRRPDSFVAIEKIAPNPDQPRRRFDEEKLRDLAHSIREKGVIQPLIVRRHPTQDGHYEIVAGERRWRASQLAQLHELPVLIRDFNDTEVLEIAIIENIQRSDLDPVEEAMGYRQLMERFGHTQEKMAEAIGKSRSHIANMLRLLYLPESVQGFLSRGELTTGHARALITSENAEQLARKIISGGLSVRQAEALAKKISNPGDSKPRKASASVEKDADTRALEGDLSAALGMKVTLSHGSGSESGTVTIKYETLDQLDNLCNVLTRG